MNLKKRGKGYGVLLWLFHFAFALAISAVVELLGDRFNVKHITILRIGGGLALLYLAGVLAFVLYKESERFNILKTDADRLRFLAEHDELTGLMKRKLFDERVRMLVSSHLSGTYFMVALDVEKFKVINDKYEFTRGDELLRLIARGAKGFSDKYGGCVTRLFADKFAVCLPYEPRRMLEFIDHMNRYIAEALLPFDVNFDCGVYRMFDLEESVDSMIDKASIAEKTVKEQYLEKFAVYDDKLKDELIFEQSLISSMSEGLLLGEFELYVQPQIDYNTQRIASGEALVRWCHNGEMIPPSIFVPIFEKNGLITAIDSFIWEETCKLLRKIRLMGIREVPLSINLSRMDLLRPNLLQELWDLITKYEIPTKMLRLEVTESAYVEESENIIPLVSSLQRNGFIIEIDDFGSGYSSLNVLRDMPADILKTDLKFLYNYGEDSKGSVILANVLRMSKDLNMSVVAEGVETKEQADFLHSLGCNIMQGYYYSKPINVDTFLELLTNDETLGG